jgi:hypothetical protein
MQALDMSGAALAEGRLVPGEAVALIARNPIPPAPFALWRCMFAKFGGRSFERQAAENGISKEKMRARPYAASTGRHL